MARLTVRRLMAVVAIVGIVLGGLVTFARWRHYGRQAAVYAQLASTIRQIAAETPQGSAIPEITIRGVPVVPETAVKLAGYYAGLAQAYEAASYRPWEVAPPHPPLPEQ